jgi:RHH-type proline utilization regulon transcriptional repressor/proline dehydrogenase/delta 1-pyrroline-5-carboxylate dehydrogenase
VIEAVLRDPGLAGWDGFGVVVQAYSAARGAVLDWLARAGRTLDRR